jgi:hypothetical protein
MKNSTEKNSIRLMDIFFRMKPDEHSFKAFGGDSEDTIGEVIFNNVTNKFESFEDGVVRRDLPPKDIEGTLKFLVSLILNGYKVTTTVEGVEKEVTFERP